MEAAALPKKLKSKLIKVPAQQLRVHPKAQRETVPSRLKDLVEHLDLDAIGVLHAVEYEINGVLAIWLIDGQHRWTALMKHGFGEWKVEVKIHTEVRDDARASELFLKLNNRTSVNPYDKFVNACQAHQVEALRVSRIVQDNTLEVARKQGEGRVCAISTLLRSYRFDEGKALNLTLETLAAAFGRGAAALEGQLIEGLAFVYKTYNGTVDRPALVKKLSKYPGGASGLLGDAKGMRQYRHESIPKCVAERVVELYNKGRKVPLDKL
jgi:hypothetical protein